MVSVAVNPPSSPPSPAPGTAKRFSIFTLGCKVNRFESQWLAQQLAAQHHRRVGPNETADLCLINTCTVTAEADRQARQLVRRAIRRNPAARIVVTGCYAQIDAAACAAIPGVDLVVGNDRKLDIPKLLQRLDDGDRDLPPVMVGEMDREISLPTQLLNGFEGRTRAFVQVQQGCDQGCTFCIIHKARGPSRSFPARLVHRQVEQLVMNGFREVVVCGVDVGSYGADLPEPGEDLTALLTRLAAIDGDFRLRLSSIDPVHITDSLIDLIAAEAVICPQLHLSMQSGDTLILKRMKRRATREILYERIEKLRRAVPHIALSADILVGFPTETEQHFGRTLDAVEDLEIAWPHVFAYSPRRGTPAAKIPSQVPPDQRKQRAARVRERGAAVWKKVAERRIGARLKVLVEGRDQLPDGTAFGRAADYFPVIFQTRPRGPGQPPQSGDWAEVEVSAVGGQELIARQLT